MKKIRTFLFRVMVLSLLFAFCFSAYKIIDYLREGAESNASRDQLLEQAVQEAPRETLLPADRQPEPPILVDFDRLEQENPDIVAWLFCDGTPINYPVLQAADNSYYLDKLPDGQWNAAGSLFLDYRNSRDFKDANSLIYGHNMKNQSMFGSISKYQDQAYYEEHPVLYLLTKEQNYKIVLLAGHVLDADAEFYELPLDRGEQSALLEKSLALSDFESQAQFLPGEELISLSTCSSAHENARYVLLGALRPLPMQR
ncbi:MAG: class B sortase [Bacillota bacterium]|nr:class B sortase [Bacillota bacterium]